MPTDDRPTVVCVGNRDERRRVRDAVARAEWEPATVSPDDVVELLADVAPRCVVVGTDDPTIATDVLEAVRARDRSIPIVVAPPRGSDEIASVAVRANASEYVPLSNGADEVTDRLGAVIEREGNHGSTGSRALESDDRHLQLLVNTLPDEAFVIDEDGRYLEARVRPESGDLYTVPPDELVGRTLEEAFPDDVADAMLSCVRTALSTGDGQSIEYEAETTDGTRSFEGRVHPVDEPVNGRRAVVWLARDITVRAERERRLRRRQDHLETLNGINAVVRQVIRTLVEAPTRADIEREVCRCLVESDLYCGSWIGEITGPESISHRVDAGEAERYLAAVAERDWGNDCGFLDAVRPGEVLATNRLQDAEAIPEPLRAAASADDVRSALAVPITHQGTTYGVLVVLASRLDAFGNREQSAFGLLGETIGFAINAVMNRRLLFSDSIVELELRVGSADSFSFDLTESYECTVTFEWAGTTADGYGHQYVVVDGLDGETAMGEADRHESVETCRLVHEDGDRCTLEIRLAESGVQTLTNYGATIEELVVEDGVATAVVAVPRDVDVRQLLDALTAVYERTELIARRDVDRPVTTAEERRDRILDRLTDRQLTALRLAFHGGYFDWPRESTGEEIAEAMDVSPPTMHQHLRLAQRALLTEFFEKRV